MQRLIVLTFLSLFLFSCSEREKTYEELEVEVLCDVLPQLAHEIVMPRLPPPPPPEKDYEKYNYRALSTECFIKLIESQKDSIKLLAKEKHKLDVGLNYNLFSINSKKIKFKSTFEVDSLPARRLKNEELVKSTLKFKYFEPDSVRFKGEFINDEDISSLISTSRVLFNSSMSESLFELYPFGCIPNKIVVISKKKNNKWIVDKFIEE